MSFYFRYRSPRFGTALLHEFYFSSRLLRYKTYWLVFGNDFCSPHFSSSSFVTSCFLEWSVSGLHHLFGFLLLTLDLFIDNLFEVWTALWMGTKEKMMHEDIRHAYNWAYQSSLWMNEAQSCKLSDFIFQPNYCYFLTWKNWFWLIQTFFE